MALIFEMVLVLFFCVLPINAQSPPQQNIIKPVPKQERAVTTSPSQVSQQQQRPENHHKTTNEPVTTKQEIKSNTTNNHANKSPNYEKDNLTIQGQLANSTDNIAKFTRYLVIVGFLQVVCLIMQAIILIMGLRFTGKTVEITETNMINSQRAFVFDKRFIVKTNKGSDSITFFPEWYNNGSTQANYLLTCINANYFPFKDYPTGLPDDYTFPDLIKREDWPMFHGPKSTFFGDPLTFDEQAVKAAMAGEGCLYTWGWVEYNDIFTNIRHRTEYCHEVVITSVDAEGIGFRTYKKHNGADDYCFKKPITKYVPPT